MRYYKVVKGESVVAIGEGLGNVEITEEEYDSLMKESIEKNEILQDLVLGKITKEEIPEKWKKELEELLYAIEEKTDSDEISPEEFVEMLGGVIG